MGCCRWSRNSSASPTHTRLPLLPQAYVLPDIVFLPTNSTVYAMNEVVPQSKPRLVVSAAAVTAARGPNLPAPRPHSGQSPAARSHRRTGSGSRDAHATSTPARWPGPGAAAGPALDGLSGLPGGLPWPQLGAQQAAAALGALPLMPLPLAATAAQLSAMLQQQAGQEPGGQQPLPQLPPLPLLPLPGQQDVLPLPLQLPLAPLPPELLPPLPPLPAQPAAAAPPAAMLATPQQPRLQRRAAHVADAEVEAEAEADAGEPQPQQSVQQEAAPEQAEVQQVERAQVEQQAAAAAAAQQQQQPSPFEAHSLPSGDSPSQQPLPSGGAAPAAAAAAAGEAVADTQPAEDRGAP